MEALCIHGFHDPWWAQEDQRGRRLQSVEAEDGSLSSEKKARIANGLQYYKAQHESVSVEDDTVGAVALVALLKLCSEHRDLNRGVLLHADAVRRGFIEKNHFVGSTLVNMYAKCGALHEAQRVFNVMPAPNIVSWNALVTGYTQNGYGKKALECFEQMQCAGLSPDEVTFACILKACGNIGASFKGQELHARIVRERFLERSIVVANALVDMYAKCGLLGKAQEVFDELPVRSVISWTALIAGYAQYGCGKESLYCYDRMQCEGFSPNAVTTVCVLKACGSIGASNKGQQIHAKIVREGLLETNVLVANALVDMYAKCDVLGKAQEVFYELQVKDVVSWTALIAGLTQHGHGEEALRCYEQMLSEGFIPNAVTYVCILKACGNIGATKKGREIHEHILKDELCEKDKHVVGIALVDMYAKCGSLAMAQEVFDRLPSRDTVLWNALIAGYAQHGYGEEVLNSCKRMQLEGFTSDAVTFACTLKACTVIGAAYKGRELHAEIIRAGLLEKDRIVGNVLLDMYASCGMLVEAQEVFEKLLGRDVVSWNALMVGYAHLGKDDVVFNLLKRMIGEGEKPNLLTFTILLNTCSHRGLLDEGQKYFETINKGYGMSPTLEHHTCMVDLFSRAGYLDKAVAVIEKMPFFADFTLCLSLLGGSQRWGTMKLGSWAFKHAAHLDEQGAAAYVCMSNIYAADVMQENEDNFEGLKVRKQVWRRVMQLAYI